jgi:hybrid cluster-associated redox disulfide protein
MSIHRYSVVEDVMRDWPATIRVFLDFKLACVGCPIATFHTLADSCHEHGIAEAPFLAALREAVAKPAAQEVLSSGA